MKHVVGVGDMKVTAAKTDEVITYALGSCLGVTVYDPEASVGGLLHVMLPKSKVNPANDNERPYMFVDTGIPLLFRECYELGALKSRIIVTVTGGASTHNHAEDYFKIGKRNLAMLKKLLWKNEVLIHAKDVGGKHSRTVSLSIATGQVTLRSNGQERPLLDAEKAPCP